MWRARRVRMLLNLMLNLPRTSLVKEKMSQDDEFYELVTTGRVKPEPPKAIRISEYSPEVEALYGVIDRLGDVVSGLVGLGGKKPRRIAPIPRPEMAASRVARRHHRIAHEALVARLLPTR